jgi:hypothetical protein
MPFRLDNPKNATPASTPDKRLSGVAEQLDRRMAGCYIEFRFMPGDFTRAATDRHLDALISA